MTDPGLNNILKWGIQNSEASRTDATATNQAPTPFDAEALQALLFGGGPSNADLMKESMAVICNEEAELENREVAFDNFEQLIENLDNANNIEALHLWTPLVGQLDSKEAKLRELAAGSCGTAVQNNIKTQERLLIVGAIPKLVRLATSDANRGARKAAITALSSAVRNFQPALDESLSHMPTEFKPKETLDANDMESVDILINKLRESL